MYFLHKILDVKKQQAYNHQSSFKEAWIWGKMTANKNKSTILAAGRCQLPPCLFDPSMSLKK